MQKTINDPSLNDEISIYVKKMNELKREEKDQELITPDPNLYYAVIDDSDGQRIADANKSANYLKKISKKERDDMGMTIIKGDKIDPDDFKNLAERLRDDDLFLYSDIKNASKLK